MLRRIKKTGFAFVLALGLIPIVAALVTYNAGVIYHPYAGGGNIVFTFNFTGTGSEYTGSYLIFNDLNYGAYWGDMGFTCPNNINITVINATTSTLTLNTTGAGSIGVYCPYHGQPSNVTGGSYVYDIVLQRVTILVSGTDNEVILTWTGGGFTPSPSGDFIPFIGTQDLIVQYLGVGDITGFIFSSYTQVLGVVFFVMLGMIVTIPIYSKLGAIPTLVFMAVAVYGFRMVLPPNAIGFIRIVLSLGLGVLSAVVLLARRRNYA